MFDLETAHMPSCMLPSRRLPGQPRQEVVQCQARWLKVASSTALLHRARWLARLVQLVQLVGLLGQLLVRLPTQWMLVPLL